MVKVTPEDLKPYLETLDANQKDKLLYRLLKKDQQLMDQLYYKHIAPDELDVRFADVESEVKGALFGVYRAKSDELALAKAIGEAKKVINRFTKVDKRPEKEVALLMIILKAVFEDVDNPARLGTCWRRYDLSVAQTLKRVITLIGNKLHEDYQLDYKGKIDRYLLRIKSASGFNDFVYDLPQEL